MPHPSLIQTERALDHNVQMRATKVAPLVDRRKLKVRIYLTRTCAQNMPRAATKGEIEVPAICEREEVALFMLHTLYQLPVREQ
jgi:hypothetical protein